MADAFRGQGKAVQSRNLMTKMVSIWKNYLVKRLCGSTVDSLDELLMLEAFDNLKTCMAKLCEKAGVRIGRDRFFEVLGERGLLLERLPKAPRTTNSRHSLPVFRNFSSEVA